MVRTTKHLKIWKDHFGDIPRDTDGRSYEIHHRDGNHSNNCIENLQLVTAQEHYDIHFAQGDYGACFKIATRLMMSSEERSEIARKAAQKLVAEGRHHLQNSEWQKERARKQIANGNNPFVGGEIQRRSNRERVASGKHHFITKNPGKNQPLVTCPHCGKMGANAIMHRYHFDRCRSVSLISSS